MRTAVLMIFQLGFMASTWGAEPTLPKVALAGLGVTGSDIIAPRQIREALGHVPEIRRLARSGAGVEALAKAAMPWVVRGYQANGFAEIKITVDGGALIIQPGTQRKWTELRVVGSTPEATAFAEALLREQVAKKTGQLITADSKVSDQDRIAPMFVPQTAARFDSVFVQEVKTRLENGWGGSGKPRPSLDVSVEPVDRTAARCVVVIRQSPIKPIQDIQVEGAVANGAPAVLAWLDREVALHPGAPGDHFLLDAACDRLEETGRVAQASARLNEGGHVIFSIVEHPMLPPLNAVLSPWQERWLELGQQMRRLFDEGSGITISTSGLPVEVTANLGRKQGTLLSLGAPDQSLACTLTFADGVLGLIRNGFPPLAWNTGKGGIYGEVGLLPTKDPEKTLVSHFELGFSTHKNQGVKWICSPAVLLAVSDGAWNEVPGQPGIWLKKDRQGKEQFQVSWDAQGVWKGWDLIKDRIVIHLSPSKPSQIVAATPGSGLELWREFLREPSRWLTAYRDQPWAEVPLGLAAGLGRPMASLWPVPNTGEVDSIPFIIPLDQADAFSGKNDKQTEIVELARFFSETLGSSLSSEAWTTWLAESASCLIESDKEGFALIQRHLDRPGFLGPIGRLTQATLLNFGGLPGAEDAARRGLAVCNADAAWADLINGVGSEELLLRWILAIDRPSDAFILVPAARRPVLAATLTAIQMAPAGERKKLLEVAFRRWWDSDLAAQVRQRLENIAGPEQKF